MRSPHPGSPRSVAPVVPCLDVDLVELVTSLSSAPIPASASLALQCPTMAVATSVTQEPSVALGTSFSQGPLPASSTSASELEAVLCQPSPPASKVPSLMSEPMDLTTSARPWHPTMTRRSRGNFVGDLFGNGNKGNISK